MSEERDYTPRDLAEIAEWREFFGAVFCPKCAKDTLPHDRTGVCLWCDTLIAAPNAGAPEIHDAPPDRFCAYCEEVLPVGGNPRQRFCSPAHKNSYWQRYAKAGRAWVRVRNGRRGDERAARRAAA